MSNISRHVHNKCWRSRAMWKRFHLNCIKQILAMLKKIWKTDFITFGNLNKHYNLLCIHRCVYNSECTIFNTVHNMCVQITFSQTISITSWMVGLLCFPLIKVCINYRVKHYINNCMNIFTKWSTQLRTEKIRNVIISPITFPNSMPIRMKQCQTLYLGGVIQTILHSPR